MSFETVDDFLAKALQPRNPSCLPCRSQEAAKACFFRDCGKGPTDCRFKQDSCCAPHYHRLIPRYGPAVDFEPPVHQWNCAGHTHCHHGQTGLVEERAITFLRDSTTGYMMRPDVCCGTVWCLHR
ncbi:hypothetical protein AVEN_215462-1 [Araneus ventricosus]|uniref:Uncharacterized protein n=1 Tax=Araneus ventricosus TaxID=182803 RepID=A0A4Y2MN16_ARAVE|nr:hypothetical protein AVEN_215462-1 [Araneus ventricosus]